MSVNVDAIKAMIAPRSPGFEQIIIAAGDEDVSAGDLLDWVHPVLAGIPGGRWYSCELEFTPGNEVFARYRSGATGTEFNAYADWTAEEIAAFRQMLPGTGALAMVMLNDYTGQVMSLMDGIARWLNIFDTDRAELRPVMKLFDNFANMGRVLA